MIFPGMDPFLEDVGLWKGFHTSLIVYFRNQLVPLLRPRYIVTIEERVYLEDTVQNRIPDVLIKRAKNRSGKPGTALQADPGVLVQIPDLEISEPFLQIVDRASKAVVTVIELVSPTNKVEGNGRKSYRSKQQEVRESPSHLVEIDLLREGRHVLAVPQPLTRQVGEYRYLACVNRAEGRRDKFVLYPRPLPEPLPRIAIPLQDGDADSVLDVQSAIRSSFDDGGYEDLLDYTAPCPSPLSPEEKIFVRKILRQAGIATRASRRGES